MTRRRLLLAGGGAAAAVAAGGYGRFAIGDTFERHLADVLDIRVDAAGHLLQNARKMLGDGYSLRAAAFLAATTAPGSTLLPAGARKEAIESIVVPMIRESSDNLVAAGLSRNPASACGGLLRRT